MIICRKNHTTVVIDMNTLHFVVRLAASAAVGLGLAMSPAKAHFLMFLPSSDVLEEGGPVMFDLVFTHPFEGGPVMQLDRPARVGMIRDGRTSDLTEALTPAAQGDVMAWTLAHDLPAPGAAVFFAEPQPYWEPAEGKYIVHYPKVVVDSFASGEGWDSMAGLPVEIMPLTRPHGLWAGNLFTGVVTRGGEPVAFAEIEVEFVNDGTVFAPNDSFITQVIRADANGTFSYAMPFAGWWGFAALLEASEPMTSPDGTQVPVEEGALIWVRAAAPGR